MCQFMCSTWIIWKSRKYQSEFQWLGKAPEHFLATEKKNCVNYCKYWRFAANKRNAMNVIYYTEMWQSWQTNFAYSTFEI